MKVGNDVDTNFTFHSSLQASAFPISVCTCKMKEILITPLIRTLSPYSTFKLFLLGLFKRTFYIPLNRGLFWTAELKTAEVRWRC
jgi:hypothetical protein